MLEAKPKLRSRPTAVGPRPAERKLPAPRSAWGARIEEGGVVVHETAAPTAVEPARYRSVLACSTRRSGH